MYIVSKPYKSQIDQLNLTSREGICISMHEMRKLTMGILVSAQWGFLRLKVFPTIGLEWPLLTARMPQKYQLIGYSREIRATNQPCIRRLPRVHTKNTCRGSTAQPRRKWLLEFPSQELTSNRITPAVSKPSGGCILSTR